MTVLDDEVASLVVGLWEEGTGPCDLLSDHRQLSHANLETSLRCSCSPHSVIVDVWAL